MKRTLTQNGNGVNRERMLHRCQSCPIEDDGRYCSHIIPPTHTNRATYVFCGAGGGKTEARTLIPYSGLAGQELNDTYLPIAGLYRDSDDLVITNASLCWDGSDRTPPESRVLNCARAHLPELLASVQPEVLVLMGGVTQRICDTPIHLNLHHGIPIYTSILNGAWEGWVWPSYEPALGMRETSKMTQLIEDFRNLGKWMRGEWTPAYLTIEEHSKDYRLIESVEELDEYLGLVDPETLRSAIDTERHGAEIWSVQLSVRKHTGRLIRTDGSTLSRRLLERLRQWLVDVCTEILLHNRGQDEDACHAVGMDIPEEKVRDTMQECFHQCSIPQALKEVVFRLIGQKMRSWEDTVWPASVAKMMDWMNAGIELAKTRPDVVVHELKRGKCADCGHQHSKGPCKHDGCESTRVTYERLEEKPSALESILTHIRRYTEQTKDEEEPYNPWVKLREMRTGGLRGKAAGKEVWEWVESEVGPMPILGIGNCELAEAVEYGCGDADMTLQLGEKLEEGRKGERWKVSEEDWDQ